MRLGLLLEQKTGRDILFEQKYSNIKIKIIKKRGLDEESSVGSGLRIDKKIIRF